MDESVIVSTICLVLVDAIKILETVPRSQAAHQAFERILYVYKTENTSIRRLLDGRVLIGVGKR